MTQYPMHIGQEALAYVSAVALAASVATGLWLAVLSLTGGVGVRIETRGPAPVVEVTTRAPAPRGEPVWPRIGEVGPQPCPARPCAIADPVE
ncbi:MAG: hypothetical protein MI723_12435 [Caulobacterales bacterium]|nr:hypothetical protein [Caulobacterales bacterium]